MTATRTGQETLNDYIAEVGRILDLGVGVPESVRLIAAANKEILGAGFRLPDALRTVNPAVPYTRNLVYACPRKRFTVIAILWGPFQETRVHDHLNWCVVKVLEGRCHSIDYERRDDESRPDFADLAIRHTDLVGSGAVQELLPPPRTNIHKMANATRGTTISLHTYGDPGTKARVFDLPTGKVEIVDLVFHNQ